jgi:catechol-2,3-dioxygenase
MGKFENLKYTDIMSNIKLLTFIEEKTMNTYPRTFSHIGISVPDVEKAAKFYSDVMGWYHIMEPTVITEESNTPIGQIGLQLK